MSDERDDSFHTETEEEMQELRARIESDILSRVLATWEGRHVLFEIIGKGNIYGLHGQMPFEVDKLNRAVGRNEVAQEVLMDALQVDPNIYILMQREAGEYAQKFKITGSSEEDDD